MRVSKLTWAKIVVEAKTMSEISQGEDVVSKENGPSRKSKRKKLKRNN